MAVFPSNAGASRAIQQQAQAWVLRIGSGCATARELQALRHWCAASDAHAQAFEQARRAWDEIGQVGRAWRAAHPAVVPARRPARRAFLGAALTAAGAAAVAGVVAPPLGLWPSVFELDADYRTATGEQRRIALADHVDVDLNTRSSLSVRTGHGRDEIELVAGEAAISSKGSDWMLEVVAGSGRLLLASGEIEVRLDAARACVTCVRGRVELRHPARTLALRGGEQVRYDERKVAAVVALDAGASVTASAWRDGAVVFRDTPLSEAVAEINRYRPGRVVLLNEQLGERKVSGKFQIARLDRAIDRIEEAFGASVRKLPGGVVLLS